MKEIKTIPEFARELGISRQRLHKFITYYQIPTEKIGRTIALTSVTRKKIKKMRVT
jgi:hypothetical protein